MGKAYQLSVDVVRSDHFAEQQQTREIRDVKGGDELPDTRLPACFDAAAVKGEAQREIAPVLRRVNQLVQHEIQIFFILPGCANSDDPSIFAIQSH